MKKVFLSILLLSNLMAFSQSCEGNYMENPNFEIGIPSNIEDRIWEADSWSKIWDNYRSGEFLSFDAGTSPWVPIIDPVPASGNHGGFWVANSLEGEREGIMNKLGTAILLEDVTYNLNFDLSVLAGYGTPEMGIYGVYNPGVVDITSAYSDTPTNLDLFGTENTVLLATLEVTGPVDGSKQNICLNFSANSEDFPANGITHIFFTRTNAVHGGEKYVGVDNFCLTQIELCNAEIHIESAEYAEIEIGCGGSFEVPVLCQGEIIVESDHCPVEQHMLSIWEWNVVDCSYGDLVYTTTPQTGPMPLSFDIWSLPGFTPSNGTVYWVEWGIYENACTAWDFDYELFMVGEDCCNRDPELELEVWINDLISGYQTVTSATYGWSSDVPFLCDPTRIYDFLTNIPCVDVYTIKNSTFNTNTWTDITNYYSASGTGALPQDISLSSGEYAAGVVNHLQVAIASPYQVVDILWVPGCDPEAELSDFVREPRGRSQESGTDVGSEIKEAGLSIFPNPTQNNFTVKLEERQSGSISVNSVDGKQLLSIHFEKQIEVNVNVSELPAGIYFVNINVDGEITTRKVIKK
jgi:hypothetical protein